MLNYGTCRAALNTSRRDDSISARDLAISATTVPINQLTGDLVMVLHSANRAETNTFQRSSVMGPSHVES